MDALTKLLKEHFAYAMTGIHVALPGVVVAYNPKTRRADIQPSLKRKLPDGAFTEFPVIPEVPVVFLGTGKYTVHIPLEKDDGVLLIALERGTDTWKAAGGSGIEETDPRRFDLSDCIAIPGLQPVSFIPVDEPGLALVHKAAPDGETVSRIVMTDDRLEISHKKTGLTLKDDKIAVKNGEKSLFTILDTFIKNIIAMKTVGSPAQHVISPGDIQKLQQDNADIAALLEA
jgi:hypothetical protein